MKTTNSKSICTGCKGTRFVGARCSACAISAVLALRALIKEVAIDVQAGDEKRPKAPDKEVLRKEGTSKEKHMAEAKDETGQDGEVEAFED
jgi:hypothetical protein